MTVIHRWDAAISRGPPVQNMTKELVVFETNSLDRDDDKWPPQNIQYFIEWLNSFLEKIPEQHRKAATINFSNVDDGYDTSSIDVSISYYRPETDEEFAVRYKVYEDALEESILHRSTIEIKGWQ